MNNEYPKWKYRGTESRTVDNLDEEEALGAEWGDSPGWESGPHPALDQPFVPPVDGADAGPEAVDPALKPEDEGDKAQEGEAAAAEGEAKKAVDMDAMFKKKDANSDGKVSKEEFLKGSKDAAKSETQFGKKDKDSDGNLTLEEFKAGGKKKAA